jgi:DNA-binding MarR family transcriptional regulator
VNVSPTETTPTRLDDLPSWLLSQAGVRSQRLLTEALAAAGARGYYYRVLAAIDQAGPISQATLGRMTGMDRSDVAAAVDELTSRRAVRRSPDPTDARRNRVSITATGQKLLTRLDAVMQAVQAELLAPLSTRERAHLIGLLRKLAP